ncbi:hypothetical protein SCLCIDRAFT_131712, partial [Scleroderma citrinum Foug A]
IFGVLKCHFCILLLAPEYNIQIQACIPAALCAIHNFICIHDGDEDPVGGEDYDELDEHGVGGTGVTTMTPDQPFTTLSNHIHTSTVHSIVCSSVSRLSLFSLYHHQLVSALSSPSFHMIT